MPQSDTYNIIKQRVLNLIAELTDFRPEALRPEMSFEHDLGLDSIKTITLSASLPDLFPEYTLENCLSRLSPQNIVTIHSIGELIETLRECIGSEILESKAYPLSPDKAEHIERPPEYIDLLNIQYLFLTAHMTVSTCSLCSRVRLKGEMNPEAVKKTWQTLLMRHPNLRARFEIDPEANTMSSYKIHILDKPTIPEIEVRDLRGLKENQKESTLHNEQNRWTACEWDIHRWPLHSFLVFIIEDNLFELFFVNTHLISDGISNQIVIREFIEVYTTFINDNFNGKWNLPSYTLDDYKKNLLLINNWKDDNETALFTQFVKQQGDDNFLWNPLSVKMNHKKSVTNSLPYKLNANLTSNLTELARALGVSLNTIVLSSYLLAIKEHDNGANNSLIINIPTSGRVYPGIKGMNDNMNIFQMVGCFAQNLSLTFDMPDEEQEPGSLFQSVYKCIQNALIAGYDRAQTLQLKAFGKLPLVKGKLPTDMTNNDRPLMKSNLYLSYIGNTKIEREYSHCEVIDYRAVTTTSANTMDTLAEIVQGSLQLTINYDTLFFNEAFINEFGKTILTLLKDFTQYKPEPKQTGQGRKASRGIDPLTESILKKTGEKILHAPIGSKEMAMDLEIEFGMDSLERIRMITAIKDTIPGVEAQSLMICSTLKEMADIIENQKESINTEDIPYYQIVKQCRQRADDIAIIHKETRITYGQLHSYSNRLANFLRSKGVSKGSFVGILDNRNPQMIIGILSILKAGAAYAPIDPTYPSGRISYMMNHSGMELLLTEPALYPLLKECVKEPTSVNTLILLTDGKMEGENSNIHIVDKKEWMSRPDNEIDYINDPKDLMVILYTSGSTGSPKGVMLNHMGYANRLRWMQKTFQLTPGERVAFKTSCSFDISLWEVFWPLMEGAVICPAETNIVGNPWELAKWINDTEINIMHFVPSMFSEFVAAMYNETTMFPTLRWLVFSGEALPVTIVQKWIDKYGMKTGLANLYGPTEASIDVTAHIITQRPNNDQLRIPIGTAIDNTWLLILDKEMNPLEKGQKGELWIGGVQLATGYLKEPEKTQNAFKPNPFPHIPSQHLYKTGDLAVELPDGGFDYLGRVDNQIKIRGYRVELGEIEAVINSHNNVDEAAVLAIDYGDNQKRLSAWISGAPMDSDTLKEFISKRLPRYMVPHTFHYLDNLPKTPNGKLDRKALLTPATPKKDNATAVPATCEPGQYPLGPAQKWLITYFDPPYEWAGYSRFKYNDRLDMMLFNEAIHHMIDTNEASRAIFIEKEGKWVQQIITPPEKFSVNYYEGSHLSESDRDSEIHNIIDRAKSFRIDRWPLFKVVVVKCSDTSYDMTIIGHHIISDFISAANQFKQLWTVYASLLTGKPIQREPDRQYSDFLTLLMEYEKKGLLDSHVDYWKSLIPSPDYRLEIPFDYEHGDNIEKNAALEKYTLGKTGTKALMSETKAYYKCNLYYLLLAPLYKVVHEWTNQEHIIISHRMNGRDIGEKTSFFNCLGNFAVNTPLLVNMNKKAGMADIIDMIKNAFEQLPANGVTFDYVSHKLPPYMYPDNKLTPVRANYLGNRTLTDSALFTPIEKDREKRLSGPMEKRISFIEFFFYTDKSELSVEIEYPGNIVPKKVIQNLGGRYMKLLKELTSGDQ